MGQDLQDWTSMSWWKASESSKLAMGEKQTRFVTGSLNEQPCQRSCLSLYGDFSEGVAVEGPVFGIRPVVVPVAVTLRAWWWAGAEQQGADAVAHPFQ